MSRRPVAFSAVVVAFMTSSVAHAGGTTTAGRFEIHFGGANGAELEWAAAVFKQADDELTPLFGAGAPSRIEVTLSRSQREWEIDVGSHSWAAGLVDGDGVFLNLPTTTPQMAGFAETVKHEAVHAMLGQRFGSNAPHWFVEGIASHFAARRHLVSSSTIFATDQEISDAFRGGDPTRRRDAYATSAARVFQLVQDCGSPAVVAWANELRTDRKAVLGGAQSPCSSKALSTASLATPAPTPRQIVAKIHWSRGDLPARAHDATNELVQMIRGSLPPCSLAPWSRMTDVDVTVVVSKSGEVIGVSADAHECQQEIADVIREWRFAPLLVGGSPVAWTRKLTFTVSSNPALPTAVR